MVNECPEYRHCSKSMHAKWQSRQSFITYDDRGVVYTKGLGYIPGVKGAEVERLSIAKESRSSQRGLSPTRLPEIIEGNGTRRKLCCAPLGTENKLFP
jgi:hypothetical protein